MEHLIFQAVLHGPWSRRYCNCVDNKFSDFWKNILYQKNSCKFLTSTTILDFAFWDFIIKCNGEARRQPAKNAWALAMDWFPVCGTLRRIIACRLNVEIRIGEAQSIHYIDSEKAIEPCISAAHGVPKLIVLGSRTDIKPLPEWKVEKVEYKMPTCVNILQLPELTASLLSTKGGFWRFAYQSLPTKLANM